jgi:hypothetical protein
MTGNIDQNHGGSQLCIYLNDCIRERLQCRERKTFTSICVLRSYWCKLTLAKHGPHPRLMDFAIQHPLLRFLTRGAHPTYLFRVNLSRKTLSGAMDQFGAPGSNTKAQGLRLPPSMAAPANNGSNLSASHGAPQPSPAPAPPRWSSPSMPPMPPKDSAPNFPQFSEATAAILSRLQASRGDVASSLAFEAKKAEVMQNYVTSDKLPTPPPIANTGKRGRGGKHMAQKTDAGALTPTSATPTTARGSGRGRGRGRGRGGGGRGGKRKRADSDESDV